jgi:hypothetical protein
VSESQALDVPDQHEDQDDNHHDDDDLLQAHHQLLDDGEDPQQDQQDHDKHRNQESVRPTQGFHPFLLLTPDYR